MLQAACDMPVASRLGCKASHNFLIPLHSLLLLASAHSYTSFDNLMMTLRLTAYTYFMHRLLIIQTDPAHS